MAKDFAHLHIHIEYLMLDGTAKIKKLVAQVKAQNQKAMAITDHGYCSGACEFYKERRARGVKPIIGIEAYMMPGTSRFGSGRVLWDEEGQKADDVSARGACTHLTFLVYNNRGLHNLSCTDSCTSLEGRMGK